MHSCDDSVNLNWLFPCAERPGTSPPKGTRSWTGQEIAAALYVIKRFYVTPSHLIVGLLQRIKTCKTFQSRDKILEEKQFPTEKSTPLSV